MAGSTKRRGTVAGRHRRVALGRPSGAGVRRHGSDLEEAPVPHRDRASRAQGGPGGGARPYANAESGRRAAQPADAGHPRPAARQVARGPRRRPIDQAGLREQHPQAHPTAARVAAPDPAGRADPGLLLRRAAPLSRALQRAATASAPHEPGARAATSTTERHARRPTRPTAEPAAAPASGTSAADWPTPRSGRSTGSSAAPSTAVSSGNGSPSTQPSTPTSRHSPTPTRRRPPRRRPHDWSSAPGPQTPTGAPWSGPT